MPENSGWMTESSPRVQPLAEVARLTAESEVPVLPGRAESFGAVLVPALADSTAGVLADPGRFDPESLRAYALDRFNWYAVADRTHAFYVEAIT